LHGLKNASFHFPVRFARQLAPHPFAVFLSADTSVKAAAQALSGGAASRTAVQAAINSARAEAGHGLVQQDAADLSQHSATPTVSARTRRLEPYAAIPTTNMKSKNNLIILISLVHLLLLMRQIFLYDNIAWHPGLTAFDARKLRSSIARLPKSRQAPPLSRGCGWRALNRRRKISRNA
jgi:hypothetical protein